MTGLMLQRKKKNVIRSVLLAAVAGSCLAAGWPVAAEAAPSCLPLGERIPAMDVNRFLADPAGLIVEIEGQPLKLKARVSSYLATDPALLKSLRPLIERANAEQRRAIGVALAQASETCAMNQTDASNAINAFVRKTGDGNIAAGFAFQMGDVPSTTPSAASKPQPRVPAGMALMQDGSDNLDIVDPFAEIPTPQ